MNKELKIKNEELQKQLSTCFPRLANTTLAERMMALAFCKKHNLNPYLKEVYLVPLNGKLAPMVNYLVLVNKVRNKYPTLKEKWEYKQDADWNIKACKLTLSIDGKDIVSQVVLLKEYNTGKNLWVSKPTTMLQKVARAQTYRMIDSEFQDLYIKEEMGISKNKEEIIQEVKEDIKANPMDRMEIEKEEIEYETQDEPIETKGENIWGD